MDAMGHPLPLVPGVHLSDNEAKRLKALTRKGVGIDERADEYNRTGLLNLVISYRNCVPDKRIVMERRRFYLFPVICLYNFYRKKSSEIFDIDSVTP